MEIYTIGFTKKTAERFFGLLKQAGVARLLDVRLNNISQLAGFAKKEDLAYFLREICGAQYVHETLLAPTQEMLDAYKKHKGDWATYETTFRELMANREIERRLDPSIFTLPTALLCSEDTSDYCHRRLILEYLSEKWGNIKATHL